ncbi:MAG: hypothetical protein H6Q75_1482 [Firmicutes bacterium]|nr:hypothetical protein [Bacillota bacterium]
MDDKKRQTVSASASGSVMGASPNQCVLGAQTGPIIVRQVVGEQERQKVLDIHVVVPDAKPPIEQIIDVFIKNVEVNSVDVITDKVIVRGALEVKAIYVAGTADQSVHAVEVKNFKWTQDVDVPGARRGMDTDASVAVEFVDYDVEENTRAYRHKYGPLGKYEECEDECEEEEEEPATYYQCGVTPTPPPPPPPPPPQPEPQPEPEPEPEAVGTRDFDVSIVLKVVAKVLADREVHLGQQQMPPMPPHPKG